MSGNRGICHICFGEGFVARLVNGEEVETPCKCQVQTGGGKMKRRGNEVLDPSVVGVANSYRGRY